MINGQVALISFVALSQEVLDRLENVTPYFPISYIVSGLNRLILLCIYHKTGEVTTAPALMSIIAISGPKTSKKIANILQFLGTVSTTFEDVFMNFINTMPKEIRLMSDYYRLTKGSSEPITQLEEAFIWASCVRYFVVDGVLITSGHRFVAFAQIFSYIVKKPLKAYLARVEAYVIAILSHTCYCNQTSGLNTLNSPL